MSPLIRNLLIGLGAVVVLLLIAAISVYVAGGRLLTASMSVPAESIEVPTDTASLQRGAHLAQIWGCRDCHGTDLGGTLMIDGMPFARLSAPNLTAGAGGVGASFTPADYERAIRHGVGGDGRTLLIMPSLEYNGATDADVGALIAYVRSVPPVDRTEGIRQLGPIGRMVGLVSKEELFPAFAIDHDAGHRAEITIGVTAEYGAYLANTCIGCHGADLGGKPAVPGSPLPAANLTPDPATGLGSWSQDDFVRVFRDGLRPDGTPVDSAMPWFAMTTMTDDELGAVWTYLRTLEPINRPRER